MLGYRAQLPASVIRQRVTAQTGAGAAIGEGLAQIGQTLGRASAEDQQARAAIAESQVRVAQIEQQRLRANAVADGMGRLAELQLDVETELEQARNASVAGADGHGESAEAIYRERWQEFSEGLLDDEEVRQHFAGIGQRWLVSGISQERSWEAQRRAAHVGEQAEVWLGASGAGLARNPSAENWAQMVADGDAMFDMQDIDGTAKAIGKRMVRERATASLFAGTLEQGQHQAVTEMIQSGAYDEFLGGADGRGQWLNRAGAVADVQAREAEQAANQRRAAALSRLRTIEVMIDNGDTVSQTDITAGLVEARAAGVPDEVLAEAAYLGDRAHRRDSVRTMATPAIEAELAQLNDLRMAGEASAEDVRQAETLEAELGGRDVRAGGNLRSMIEAGPQGQAAALDALAGLPPERAFAAAREAGSPRLPVYIKLNQAGRQQAIEGAGLRAERPADFLPPATSTSRNGGGGAAEADRIFREAVGRDIVDQLGTYYDEHRDAALDLMAGGAREWNRDIFLRSIQAIAGQTRRADGTLQGGIARLRHGQRVELPPRWSQGEFDARFNAEQFAEAYYGDGSQAQADDVRRNYRLRYVGVAENGHHDYAMIGPDGRPLHGPNGSPYRLRVRPTYQAPVATAPMAATSRGGN